jgi:phosphatidylinositol alpha-mannosyltransferase
VGVARRGALAVAALLAAALAVVALDRIGVDAVVRSLVSSSPTWVLVGLGVMCASMVLRALAWQAILRAALPGVEVRRADALQGTFIGVLMSATLPARLGEPSRALIVARRLGRPRELLPVVLGTIVSQTLLNALALVLLGVVMVSTVDVFTEHTGLVVAASAPLAAVLLVLGAPAVARRDGRVRRALGQVRAGLRVFRAPRLGAQATVAQLAAWALQWLSCFLLLVALGLDAVAGAGAAAAVLFAVNVTAVLPATPSNLGVFQAACVAVLGAYGVGAADALAYGIVLQAVEIATAVVMGAPALVKEGLSWREVRLRALHATPVELPPLPAGRRPASSRT